MFGKISSQSEEILVFFFLQNVHAEKAGKTTIPPNMFSRTEFFKTYMEG